ncbi:3-methyl-2-oxobutanoate dehydrogenase subunit VorB [uncultured Victivallis sp.]|uniref:3-methyl-2-oxobutanoate dehydrogenase subunit VorB n=1 Tax=Victivallis sp. TaxID=2049020 RepID=UPI0025F0EE3F|nr:3-methyl-2-oxobutanoate dehydrogenase subunit VorB [uncultured Victivallis sp.]
MEYTNRMLLKGNEAVVYGALLAGCECYFGYPITPASEIAHTAARCFPKLGRTFLQAECEIAAINMVMGAAANGRRAMTASSGLGISLKQEGISYLSGCELPALVVDITRGGPGLGNIAPEQADYNQVVKGGGHGSYRCIVLAPASAQEMCDLAFTAFDLAEKYRIVVYMLTDGVIGQTMETVTLPEPLPRREVPEWALDVSRPRTNMISSIYLETDDLEALNLRLQEKYRRIEAAEQRCELYQAEDADVLLVGYGISGRLARTAVDELRERGIRAGLLRPITLFPFPVDELRRLRAKQLIAVEMSCGQMIDDVKLAINCDRPVHLINRMGGNIPGTGEIVERTIKLISAEEK